LPAPKVYTKENVDVEAEKSVKLVEIPYGSGDITLISFLANSPKFKLYVKIDGKEEDLESPEFYNSLALEKGIVYKHYYSDAESKYGMTSEIEIHFDKSAEVWVVNKDTTKKTLIAGIVVIENFCEGKE